MFGRKKKKQQEAEAKTVASEITSLLMNPNLEKNLEEAKRRMAKGATKAEIDELIRLGREERPGRKLP